MRRCGPLMARGLSFNSTTTSTPSKCHCKILDQLNQVKYKMKLYSKASLPNGVGKNCTCLLLNALFHGGERELQYSSIECQYKLRDREYEN